MIAPLNYLKPDDQKHIIFVFIILFNFDHYLHLFLLLIEVIAIAVVKMLYNLILLKLIEHNKIDPK